MKKVSTQFKHARCAMFMAGSLFFSTFLLPQNVQALTISYSDPVQYSVTTYKDPTSSLLRTYSPTTVTINGRSYTYYTVSNADAEPSQKPLPSQPDNTAADTNLAENAADMEVLAEGTKWATKLYIIRSNVPGPTVMVVGGVHGSEEAGYKAAEQIKDWSIEKGTLLVLPHANQRAIDINRRYVQGEGDLNRDFPQSSSESPDNTLSKAIYNAVQKYDVDWLMDMHEGYDFYKNKSTDSVGQSLIYYPHNNMSQTAESIVDSLNAGISTSYHEFSLLKYPVKGSLARATAQYLGVNSFIFETCEKQSLSTRINYQLKAAEKLLSELGMK